MKRIWFKPRMVKALIERRKKTTFRSRKHEGLYEVVRGSWYDSIPVGIVIKLTPLRAVTKEEVIEKYYRQEAFDSPEDFREFIKTEKLKMPEVGILHGIEVKEVKGCI